MDLDVSMVTFTHSICLFLLRPCPIKSLRKVAFLVGISYVNNSVVQNPLLNSILTFGLLIFLT